MPVFLAGEVLTRDLRVARRNRRLRPTPIDQLTAGDLRKVSGTIRAVGPSLTAPVSGESSVYYHAIEEKRVEYFVGGAPAEKWLEVGEEQDACWFALDGEGGTIQVEVTADSVVVLSPASAYTAHVEAQSRWREAVLLPGDHVTVIGVVALEPDPSATEDRLYRAAPPLRPVLRGSPRTPLMVER